MLARVLLAASLFLLCLVALETAAGACSCSDDALGPPKVLFEGRAAEVVGQGHLGPVWSFDVRRVVRGEVADRQDAEVATGGEAGCGLRTAPVVAGALYEVGAHPGERADGGTALFVNYCGGSLRRLELPSPTTAGAAVPIEGEQDGTGPQAGWTAGVAITLTAAAAIGGVAFGIRRG